MGTINDYGVSQAKYHEGSPNTVLSVTPVFPYAVRFTDGEGKESMCLVYCFGEQDDGGLGVFIVANEREMVERLRRPGPKQLAQIRQHIAELEENANPDQIPETDPNVASALADVVEEPDAATTGQ